MKQLFSDVGKTAVADYNLREKRNKWHNPNNHLAFCLEAHHNILGRWNPIREPWGQWDEKTEIELWGGWCDWKLRKGERTQWKYPRSASVSWNLGLILSSCHTGQMKIMGEVQLPGTWRMNNYWNKYRLKSQRWGLPAGRRSVIQKDIGLSYWLERAAMYIQWVGTRDDAKNSTMHRTTLQKKEVCDSKFWKSWSWENLIRVRLLWPNRV